MNRQPEPPPPQKVGQRSEGRTVIIEIRIDPQRQFSAMQRQEIWMRSNGHCVACGRHLGESWRSPNWHADHIVPHSRGGRTEIINGQSLCQPCNNRKHAKVLTVDQEG
jgi:5-methylcytosine-specific restriction endonuclease McrA